MLHCFIWNELHKINLKNGKTMNGNDNNCLHKDFSGKTMLTLTDIQSFQIYTL